MLKIISPNGIVFPYLNSAKKYLLQGGDVKNFYKNQFEETNQAIPITISWQTDENPLSFSIKYGTDKALKLCNSSSVNGNKRQIEVYNLLKSATYYVEIIAYYDCGKVEKAQSSFKTTDLGPRPLKIDGIYNVRDIGGYTLKNGKKTLQNKILRGGTLTPCKDCKDVGLSDSGKAYMSEVLNIKTEIELRSPQEAEQGKVSAIPKARLVYATLAGYDAIVDFKEGVIALFNILADKQNYPVYIHCTGGADRTGTVCFLINALLGVDENALIQDYEFTSFSYYGVRSTKSEWTQPLFEKFIGMLNRFDGNTLSKKVENLLLFIGVSPISIANLRKIMID